MNSIKKVLLILLAVIAMCFVVFLVILFISMMPTRGKKITSYVNPQKAVLVIDIQRDFTAATAKPPFPYKNADKLIVALNKLTKEVAQNNITVIYLRQEFAGFFGKMFSRLFCRGKGIKGNPGTEFDGRLFIASDHIFPKPKGDAFSDPKFEAFLIEHRINELYLTGLDAEYCVYHTAKGALSRGYNVNIITDAILLFDEKKWEDILDKYRKNGIVLQTSDKFLENVILD
ncbi:MAG: isochorismatase family cysteine hydrolase [bacterium]